MSLDRNIRAVRRRWWMVVVFALVGGVAALVTTPHDKPAATVDYYRATNTLITDSATAVDDPTSSPLLPQAPLYVETGTVPERVAEKLGSTVEEVTDQVYGESFSQFATVDVTAVSTDPDEAVTLADTTASELLTFLDEEAKREFDTKVDEVSNDLDDLEAERNELIDTIANDPSQADILGAKLNSVVNQYGLKYDEYRALQEQDSSAGFRSLQAALPRQIDEDEYNDILDTIQQNPGEAAAQAGTADAQDSATGGSGLGVAGVTANPITRTFVGLLFGGFLGLVGIVLLDRNDRRIRVREDAEEAFGLPVLAEIPRLGADSDHTLITQTAPRSAAADAFRLVRTALLYVQSVGRELDEPSAPNGDGNGNGNGTGGNGNGHKDARVILVTSAGPSEGKTTLVANLAAVLADGDLSVLVVDCDFRRPRVGEYLPSEDSDGEILRLEGGKGPEIKRLAPRAWVVTGIGADESDRSPLEIVSEQMRVIETARSQVDVILLDTAPLLTTNDPSDLLHLADLVLLVARAGRTTRRAAHRSSELLARFGARVLGVVFNDSTEGLETGYGSYGYGYGYYRSSSNESLSKSGGARADEPVTTDVDPIH